MEDIGNYGYTLFRTIPWGLVFQLQIVSIIKTLVFWRNGHLVAENLSGFSNGHLVGR